MDQRPRLVFFALLTLLSSLSACEKPRRSRAEALTTMVQLQESGRYDDVVRVVEEWMNQPQNDASQNDFLHLQIAMVYINKAYHKQQTPDGSVQNAASHVEQALKRANLRAVWLSGVVGGIQQPRMNELVQAIRSVDLKIYHFLSLFAGNRVLDRLASHAEANNLLKGGIFFAMYWYVWFCNGSDRERRRRAIISIMIGAILAIIVSRTVAFIAPFRLRPMYDPALTHPSYSIPLTANLENWSAFPSDTAAYFFALAFGLAYLLRRLAIPLMLYAAVWICLPRMYFGLHYASDIVVGIAIGISVVWVSLRSELLHSIVAPRALAAMETRPQWFYAIAFLLSLEMATVFGGLRDVGRVVLHGALVGSHFQYSPIGEWGGLLAMAGFLVIAGSVAYVLYRVLHRVRLLRNKR